jgi:hypothetical protein
VRVCTFVVLLLVAFFTTPCPLRGFSELEAIMKAFWVPDKTARNLWAAVGIKLPARIKCQLLLVPPKGIRPRNILLKGPHGRLFTVTWRSVQFIKQ